MLVVEPSALRYEEATEAGGSVGSSGGGGGGAHDEHLMERVSTLERQLMRMVEKLEQGIDLLLRQVRTSYMDHMLLETLIEALGETKTIDYKRLYREWRERCDRDSKETEKNDRLKRVRTRVLVSYRGAQSDVFTRLVKEGFSNLENDEEGALRTLERAAALAPDNLPLHAFLGERFFVARKWTLARDYLERGFDAAEQDARLHLLLGLACGEEGETVRARELLNEAIRLGGPCFAAHYALGSLLASEENWEAALLEFKLALEARPSAEAHYVVGSVYHQVGRRYLARRHLVKALKLDPQYAEAHYVLGIVYLGIGDEEHAKEAFASAYAADKKDPRYLAAKRRRRFSGDLPPTPLSEAFKNLKHRLMGDGDERLSLALQEDALRYALAR
jgi:Flp pilus assembly protein TadD